MTNGRNTPCIPGYETPRKTVPAIAEEADKQRIAPVHDEFVPYLAMHVARKTNQELVVVDSSIWISVFLLCASVPVAYQAVIHAQPKVFLVVGLFLLFVLLFWRKEVVVFDAARQQAEWTRRRLLKVATGTIPFGEITGIGLETTSADSSQTFRLTILTAQGSVAMSDSYSGNLQNYENLKRDILDFLKIDSGKNDSVPGRLPLSAIADEASVRSLLEQGRTIDAIQLVRSTQKISLTEAHDLVEKMAEQRKTLQ